MRPIVLSIAGSDSSGGAGIQADIKSIEANGGFAANAITAITAQNSRGIFAARSVGAELLRRQLDAVFDDLDIAAVKSGMLHDAELVLEIARTIAHRAPRHFVCDPLLVASSGDPLLDGPAVEELKRHLFPLATIVTPNAAEAQALSGIVVRDVDSAVAAARRILALGPRAVLVTGGHFESGAATDVLLDSTGLEVLEGEWIDSPHTHGTGCAYAAAIATRLACGRSVAAAALEAKQFVTEAIRHGLPLGEGYGPTDPLFFLHDTVGRAPAAPWRGAAAREERT